MCVCVGGGGGGGWDVMHFVIFNANQADWVVSKDKDSNYKDCY